MKKIMMLIILIIIVMSSCSARDIELWEEVQRENKERGRDCAKAPNGQIVCGYTRY